MEATLIETASLKRVLENTYEGDEAIVKLYDPNVSVSSVKEVVDNIFEKIERYGEAAISYAVRLEGNEIGYFVLSGDFLVSFGLNVRHRTTETLRSFFEVMKSNMPADFVCALWSKNERAIRWLTKNGMKNLLIKNEITVLCQ